MALGLIWISPRVEQIGNREKKQASLHIILYSVAYAM